MQRESDDRLDRALLARIADGDRQALGPLYDTHALTLFHHALALTRHRPDAEDLEQGEVIVLHAMHGYSLREVGAMTHVSLFTAASRYRLARARLRRLLDRSGGR